MDGNPIAIPETASTFKKERRFITVDFVFIGKLPPANSGNVHKPQHQQPEVQTLQHILNKNRGRAYMFIILLYIIAYKYSISSQRLFFIFCCHAQKSGCAKFPYRHDREGHKRQKYQSLSRAECGFGLRRSERFKRGCFREELGDQHEKVQIQCRNRGDQIRDLPATGELAHVESINRNRQQNDGDSTYRIRGREALERKKESRHARQRGGQQEEMRETAIVPRRQPTTENDKSCNNTRQTDYDVHESEDVQAHGIGLRLNECEQVGVELLLARIAEAVRTAGINFQRGIRHKLRRSTDGHDLIIIAVNHQRRHIEFFQVFGEVGFREGLDAIIRILEPRHHALHPPRFDQSLRHRRAGAVEIEKRAAGDIEEELRPIREIRRAEPIEHLDRQPAGIGVSLEHDRRNGTH